MTIDHRAHALELLALADNIRDGNVGPEIAHWKACDIIAAAQVHATLATATPTSHEEVSESLSRAVDDLVAAKDHEWATRQERDEAIAESQKWQQLYDMAFDETVEVRAERDAAKRALSDLREELKAVRAALNGVEKATFQALLSPVTTADTTLTAPSRERDDSGPLTGTLYLAPSAAGDPTLWMRREDGRLIAVVSDYQLTPSVRAEAWAALTANALPLPEGGDL